MAPNLSVSKIYWSRLISWSLAQRTPRIWQGCLTRRFSVLWRIQLFWSTSAEVEIHILKWDGWRIFKWLYLQMYHYPNWNEKDIADFFIYKLLICLYIPPYSFWIIPQLTEIEKLQCKMFKFKKGNPVISVILQMCEELWIWHASLEMEKKRRKFLKCNVKCHSWLMPIKEQLLWKTWFYEYFCHFLV